MARRSALEKAATKDLVQLIKAHKKKGSAKRLTRHRGCWPMWACIQAAGGLQGWSERGAQVAGPMYRTFEIGAHRVALKYNLTYVQEMLIADAMFVEHRVRLRRHDPMPGMARDVVSLNHVDTAPLHAARVSWRILTDVYGSSFLPLHLLLSPKLTEIILRLQLESITK